VRKIPAFSVDNFKATLNLRYRPVHRTLLVRQKLAAFPFRPIIDSKLWERRSLYIALTLTILYRLPLAHVLTVL